MFYNKKILFIENKATYFLTHRLSVAKYIKSKGAEVCVSTLVQPNDKIISEINSYGFRFIELRKFRLFQTLLRRLIFTLPSLISLNKNVKPDIIHYFTIRASFWGAIYNLISGNIKSIFSITGLGYLFSSNKRTIRYLRSLILIVFKICLKKGNYIVTFQNPDDMELFIKKNIIKKNSAELIKGSGVEVDYFKPNLNAETHESINIILASRMLWNKGIGEFVEAAKQAKKDNSSVNFILVGEIDNDNPEAISKDQLDYWSSRGFVEWWGHRSNMAEIFNYSDIVCLPSFYREGIPKVLIEAASSGCPIITTDVPGCREIVLDGFNGILVSPRDSEELYSAIKKLVKNESLRKSMGVNGRERVIKEFSSEIVNNKIIRSYHNLLSRR